MIIIIITSSSLNFKLNSQIFCISRTLLLLLVLLLLIYSYVIVVSKVVIIIVIHGSAIRGFSGTCEGSGKNEP